MITIIIYLGKFPSPDTRFGCDLCRIVVEIYLGKFPPPDLRTRHTPPDAISIEIYLGKFPHPDPVIENLSENLGLGTSLREVLLGL